MTILYFSATGNCLAVAKKLGGELLSIPKLVKEGRYEITDDVIGVVCPTYCADAPKMVQRYGSKDMKRLSHIILALENGVWKVYRVTDGDLFSYTNYFTSEW